MNKPIVLIFSLLISSVIAGLYANKASKMLPSNGITSYTTIVNGVPTTLCTTTQLCTTTGPGGLTSTYTTILSGNRCPPRVLTYTTICDD